MSYPQPPQGPPPQPPIPPQAGPHAMNPSPYPPQFAPSPATPWYFKKWFVVVMLIIFFPVGLVLCWLSPETKLVGRVVWSVLWAFILLMRIAGGGSSSPVPSTAPASSPGSTPAATAPAKVDNSNLSLGTTVTAGDLEVTVNSVRVGDGLDGKAILADVTMKNVGKQPQTVSSLLMWEMRDSQGYKLDFTIGVTDRHGTLDGTIGAGSQLRGELAFKLKDAKGALELIFSQPFKSSQYIWKIPAQ